MKLVLALPQVCYNEYESILFKAIFSLAYFGLFRVGELAAINHYQAGYALQLSDLTFTHEKLVAGIRFSKTNLTGKPVFLNIKKVDDKNICPLVNMQQFLRLGSSRPGNLFIHANGLPVTRYQFGAILIKAIAQVGLSNSYYKSHSFRIGRATDLDVAGVSCDEIKLVEDGSQAVLILMSGNKCTKSAAILFILCVLFWFAIDFIYVGYWRLHCFFGLVDAAAV